MGEWVVLWSIPIMIWSVEQVMTGAAAAKMTHLSASGGLKESNICFHHLLYVHLLFATVFLLLGVLSCFVFPIATWLDLKEISLSEAQRVTALIFIYMTLVIFASIVRLPFFTSGKFWLGNLHQVVTQAAVLLVQAALLLHSSTARPLILALGIVGTHGLFLLGLLALFTKHCRQYTLAWRKPDRTSLRALLADNLPMAGFTLAQSAMVQTFFLSIQLALGPYFVSAFSVGKTFSRTFYQCSSMVLTATSPELTAAVVRCDYSSARKIGFMQIAFIIPFFFCFAVAAVLFQETILQWWTHAKVALSRSEICIFLLGVLFLTLWSRQSQLLVATLRHRRFFLLASGILLLIAAIVFIARNHLRFEGFILTATLAEALILILSLLHSHHIRRYWQNPHNQVKEKRSSCVPNC